MPSHRTPITVVSLAFLALGGCAASHRSTHAGRGSGSGEAPAPAPASSSAVQPLTSGSVEEVLTAEAAAAPEVKFLPATSRREVKAADGWSFDPTAAVLAAHSDASADAPADTTLKFQGDPKNQSNETKNFGNDLTRPLARLELDSTYIAGLRSSDTVVLTPRVDLPISLGGHSYFYSRADLPYVLGTNRVSNDNPNGDWTSGLGDLRTEFAFVTHDPDGIGLAAGVDLIFPTATQDEMGTNQYIWAPLVGASYVLDDLGPDSYVGLFLRNFFSYAETEDSPKINELSIEPQFQWQWADHWYVLVIPEILLNWEDGGRMFLPLEVEVGTMIADHFRIAGHGSITLLDEYEVNRWSAGVKLTWFF